MRELCPICKTEVVESDVKCKNCGFDELHKVFISKIDAEEWMNTVVVPKRKEYEQLKIIENKMHQTHCGQKLSIKKGFVLKQLGDIFVIFSNDSELFSGVITINDVGAIIWKGLENNKSKEEILEQILSEYEVDKKTASEDFEDFISGLKSKNIVIEH